MFNFHRSRLTWLQPRDTLSPFLTQEIVRKQNIVIFCEAIRLHKELSVQQRGLSPLEFKLKPIMIHGSNNIPGRDTVSDGDRGAGRTNKAKNIFHTDAQRTKLGGYIRCTGQPEGLAYNSSSFSSEHCNDRVKIELTALKFIGIAFARANGRRGSTRKGGLILRLAELLVLEELEFWVSAEPGVLALVLAESWIAGRVPVASEERVLAAAMAAKGKRVMNLNCMLFILVVLLSTGDFSSEESG